MVESREFREESSELDPLRKKDIYCPHCEDTVPKSTYYRHRQQFYNAAKVWTNVNLIRERPSKGIVYQCEYQPQVENDDFTNLLMEAVSTTGTGHTDVDEQESRAEGLSQPANACTQCVGQLKFLVVPKLYYM